MKKALSILFFMLCIGLIHGQDKERRSVIVVMNDQYDETSMTRLTQFMDKAQRRTFVINDHQSFCANSQQATLQFMESLGDEVLAVKPFWVFNGFACQATDDAIRQLEARSEVAYVYHDMFRKRIPDNEKPREVTAKDTGWHVDKVNAPAVWNYEGTGYTGNGVVVAILDTGVNYNHIDLQESMWDGGTEYPHHGYDVVNHDDDPMDDYGHGSHCAGIVAGQGNAGTQTGIAPGAKVMAIKIMDETGYGGDEQLFEGIEFALAHGADILSCSFGDPDTGPYAPYRHVSETVLEAGVVAAVAAGNTGEQQYAYPIPFNIQAPGNCPPPWRHPDQQIDGGRTAVVCVGATDANDSHCSFSSVGPTTWAEGTNIGSYDDYPYANGDATQPGLIRPDISAPGANIISVNYATNNDYIAYDGTSMATPCVAGVLALLLEVEPELSPAELDSIVELTAVRAGNSKKDNRVGAGRIDALAAVNALFYHGPTNLTADFDGTTATLQWDGPSQAVSYEVYRDGLRIANGLNETSYIDHLNYGGHYSYYVTAVLENGLTTLPSNYVHIEKAVDIEAEVINNLRVELTWNMPNSLFDGFESGDFYQSMWLNDASSPWVITNNNPHGGSYCAKSTNQAMFSSSSLGLAVNLPMVCVIRYYARISCFPLNGGGFFIDNVQQGEAIKDEVPWTQYSFALSPGNHLLEWKYGNQLSEGDYDNAFYIDDITVGNPFNVYRDDCSGNDPELIAENVTEAHYIDYGWDALPIGQYKYGISNDFGASIAWSECLNKTVLAVEEASEALGIKRITIINTLGQVLYDASTSTDESATILERLPKGVYLVNLLTENGRITRKVCR